jgi:diacylglycerol kinase (ATP)
MEYNFQNNKMKRFIKSFYFALKGIYQLFKNERNAKIHLLISIAVISFSFYFNISKLEWIIIIFSIAAVFTAEAFNTSIEKMVDFVSLQHHEKAGQIKDLAAGAVLITAIAVAIVGLIVFIPKLSFLYNTLRLG